MAIEDPLELLTDVAFVLDPDGVVAATNRATCERLGPETTLVKRPVRELVTAAFRAPLDGAIASAREGTPSRLELAFEAPGRPPMRTQARIGRSRRADGGLVLVLVARDVSAGTPVDEELRRTSAFLDSVVENIPDMIFVKRASDLMFVRFNKAGEDLLGWSRHELVGKTDHDFYPKEQGDFFHQKDRETLAKKQLVDIPEEPILTRHQGTRILHTQKIPVLDERGEPMWLLGISQDITERVQAEQRSRELALVAQHTHDAIVSWQPDGRLASWNPGAQRLFGWSADDAIGQLVETIVPPALLLAFRARHDRLLAGERVPVEQTTRLRQDSREVEVEESAFAIKDAAGKVVRIACLARDVSEVLRLRRTAEILAAARGEHGEDDEAAMATARMREVVDAADLVAHDPRATVLLLGETGVGKSWLARRIHRRSPRARRAFFEINCAGLTGQLVESELFGHERGAFTGAVAQKRGLVETAEGGTLFLDEVAELSQGAQAQLLTFLDTQRFRRVGGNRQITADVRLIAATNVDLKKAAEEGRFRRDLFYRLNVVPITVPPLRERPEDVPPMARRLVEELARRVSIGPRRPTIDDAVLPALQRYTWPGNVRELRNTLERALILSRGAAIRLDHLPPDIRDAGAAVPADVAGNAPLGTFLTLDDLERAHILRALDTTHGNRTAAAGLLGISRSTLKRKLATFRPDLAE